IRLAEVPRRVVTLTEPDAAAIAYAAAERVTPGEVIAVYDLGGGTFDAAVLRKIPNGFELLGEPEGVEHLGGVDIDELVFDHVREAVVGALDDLPVDDPVLAQAVARLRLDCIDAKEALSSDVDVSIPVVLPHLSTEVRLTRSELEEKVAPILEETIAALRRSIRSAGLAPPDIDRVLLVGGSSRLPLVAQLVSQALGRPYFIDAHPKHGVALGAARTVGEALTTAIVPAVVVAPEPEPAPASEPEPVPSPASAPGPPVATASESAPEPTPAPVPPPLLVPPPPNGAWRLRRRRRVLIASGLVVAVAAAAVGIVVLLDDDGGAAAPTLAPGEPIPLGRFPDGIAVDGDQLWVTSTFASQDGDDDLARIDIVSGEVVDSFQVGGEPIGVVVAEGSVWVARRAADEVVRLDPETGEELATIPAAGKPHDLSVGAGALWAAGSDGVLTRIDPATNTSETALEGEVDLSGVAASADRVWVTYDANPGQVAVLDPTTFEVLDSVSVHGDVDDLALADSGVWVAQRDFGSVVRVDLENDSAVEVAVDAGPAGIAADGDRVWVINNESGTLTLIDGPSAEVVDTIEVGDRPLTVVTTPGEVWVSLSGENALARIAVED
ncbi:MAG TPA: Hsp70 family protein, partial [Acidimicrobiales bacterium]